MSRFPGAPPLSIALLGLDPGSLESAAARRPVSSATVATMNADWLARQLAAARTIGFEAVQLNATAQGLRPRELDRSARRHIASLFRREALAFSGLDLFIPHEHYHDPAHVDRAVAAVINSLDLCAELAQLSVTAGPTTASASGATSAILSVDIPANARPEVRPEIAGAALARGVLIADHNPRFVPGPEAALGAGIDPAASLAEGVDPLARLTSLGRRVISFRWTDPGKSRITPRTAPGSRDSKFDATEWIGTLGAIGYTRPAILDLRGLPRQAEAMLGARAAWKL